MDRANFLGHTFDLVSVKSISYACTVENDAPLLCTVRVKVQIGFWALKRKSGGEHKNYEVQQWI